LGYSNLRLSKGDEKTQPGTRVKERLSHEKNWRKQAIKKSLIKGLDWA